MHTESERDKHLFPAPLTLLATNRFWVTGSLHWKLLNKTTFHPIGIRAKISCNSAIHKCTFQYLKEYYKDLNHHYFLGNI